MKHGEKFGGSMAGKRFDVRPGAKPQVIRLQIGEATAIITITMTSPTSRARRLQPPDSVAAFIRAWTRGETIFPCCPCSSTDLFRAFRRWCTDNGKSPPVASHQFLEHVSAQAGWSNRPHHVYTESSSTTTRSTRIVIPPASVLKRARSARKETASATRWLTDSLHAFRAALGETGA